MNAVINQNALGAPVAFVGLGSAKSEPQVNTEAGTEFAFHQMFGTYDPNETLSAVRSTDQDAKELLSKAGAEDASQIDEICADPPIFQPIAQIFANLPMPSEALLKPTVTANDTSKPALDRSAGESLAVTGAVVPGISGGIDDSGLQQAGTNPETLGFPQGVSSSTDLLDPDSPTLETEEKYALLSSSTTGAVAEPDETDLHRATFVPLQTYNQQSPSPDERFRQASLGAGDAPDNPKATIEYPKSSAHFSTVENTWRHKWTGDAAALAIAEDDTANQTLAGDPDEAENPQAPQLVSNKILPHSAPLAQHSTPSAPPAGPAIINFRPKTDLPPPPVAAEKIQSGGGPEVFVFNQALGVSDIELSLGSTQTSPEIGPTLGAARRVASSVFVPTPAALMPNQSAMLASRITEMSITRDNGPVDVSLSPDELGKLTISIKQDGSFVHVTLTAERPETLDLMRRNASDLIADLRQTGFSGASLSFGQGQKDQHPNFQNADLPTRHQQSPQNLIPETRPIASGRTHDGVGVDLRF